MWRSRYDWIWWGRRSIEGRGFVTSAMLGNIRTSSVTATPLPVPPDARGGSVDLTSTSIRTDSPPASFSSQPLYVHHLPTYPVYRARPRAFQACRWWIRSRKREKGYSLFFVFPLSTPSATRVFCVRCPLSTRITRRRRIVVFVRAVHTRRINCFNAFGEDCVFDLPRGEK